MCGKVNHVYWGAEAKASLNRAIESHARYPKPSDLTMSRVKPHESGVEARTR